MTRKNLLLVFGGESSEHDISIMSATNVYNEIDTSKYDITLCYIDTGGKWINVSSVKDCQAEALIGQTIYLTPSESAIRIGNQTKHIDVAFPVLHGKNGEDGTIQGLFEALHIPYVGPSLLGAAATMDKNTTKHLLSDVQIPVVPWVTWETSDKSPSYEDMSTLLGETLFVKPSRAGSSLGASLVNGIDEWNGALEEAARHDSVVLIEKGLTVRELQVSALGNNDVDLSDICGIDYGAAFHDFDDKYSETSTASFTVPAKLSVEDTALIKSYALKAYEVTSCRGMARIDFFQDLTTGDIYLNEINTIPGFTSVSVYPMLWQKAGLTYPKLLDRLIDLALQ